MSEEKIDPGHATVRDLLRILGPIIAIAGLVLMVVGIASFFSAFGTMRPPRYFWCAFIGMPLLGVGIILCKFGYAGKVARYMAGEIAPVGKDTINYMADGTKDSVKTIATAIGEGLRGGQDSSQQTMVRCHKCNALVDAAAKFCGRCGQAIQKNKTCPTCKELNDPDAKFCDNCGYKFA